ncbi:MAG: CFI-box-CTERM domain-containing protein [Sphingomonas sp.]
MSDGADGNIENLMGMARTAELAGNSAEAMSYFNRVLEIDPRWPEAWLGKGKAAGWQSSLAVMRFSEMVVAFNHAIGAAADDRREAIAGEAAEQINRLVTTLYGMAHNHMLEFAAVDNVWATYLNQVSQMLDALEASLQWTPDNRTTLENIIHLCKDNVEGVTYRDRIHNNAPGWHGITPEYEQSLLSRRDSAIARLQAINPEYLPSSIEKKKAEACFVVTATMGDYDHPKVRLMRRFRDEWLDQKPIGRWIIVLYYRVGPLAASFISKNPLLKKHSI